VLPPDSPAPGQLAGLCARLGIDGHGITAPPNQDLPERWQSILTPLARREPWAPPPLGILAAAVAELPELDSAQITIIGLHHGERGTIMHLLVSGVTLEEEWAYARGVRPLPVLWIRDSDSRWHATGLAGVNPWGNTGVTMVSMRIVPRWIAAPPGSRSPPPGHRLRSGPPCSSARSDHHASLTLALRTVQTTVAPGHGELDDDLARIAEGLTGVQDDLREIARGIHPAILAHGGLAAALKALARCCSVPVQLDVRTIPRLPERVEVAAYYVIAEALGGTITVQSLTSAGTSLPAELPLADRSGGP
jgi:hypothetical protein